MPRRRVPGAFALLALILTDAGSLVAQWHTGRELPLVVAAADARIGRDTSQRLAGWQAMAHGVVRFALVVDHDGTPIERVVRADELRLEVYGEAPSRSKQRIVAWRDTSYFPNRLVYHRDHLGIVAHDFGPTIRIGEGDEVQGVPHPLSPRGLDYYEFRPGPTVRVTGPTGEVRVVAVDVRPRMADSAGAVGTLYLDADRGALVRFRFTFTGSAYRDARVEGISVALENALIDGTTWLPWHQSIVIHRTDPVFGLPLGSTLRADWEITDYRIGVRLPPETFTGAAVAGPANPGAGSWDLPLTVALADAAGLGAALDRVSADASSLVTAQLLKGMPGLTWLGADGLSGVVRVNRVAGVRLGASVVVNGPGAGTLALGVGYGTSDHRVTGSARFAWAADRTTWRLSFGREMIDLGDRPRISGLANSLTTLFGGDDLGDWRLKEWLGVGADWNAGPVGLAAGLSVERHHSVRAAFAGLGGELTANPPLGYGEVVVARLGLVPSGALDWRLGLEHGEGDATWSRAAFRAEVGLPLGLAAVVRGGFASTGTPVGRSFLLGGLGSLPGAPDRRLGGRRMLLLRLDRPIRVGLPLPGGVGGQAAAAVPLVQSVAPFVAIAKVAGAIPAAPWRMASGWSTVVGLGMTLGDPILRIEVGWHPPSGGVLLSIDADRLWWPIL